MNYYDSRLVLIETAMREREIEAAQMQGLLKALVDEVKGINKHLEKDEEEAQAYHDLCFNSDN